MKGTTDAPFGLDARAHRLLEAVLRRHPRIAEARVFGSRAMGTHRAESDIDLALYGEVDDLLAARVAGELDELPLPYQFDVRAYPPLRYAPLRQHIDRVGQPIFIRGHARSSNMGSSLLEQVAAATRREQRIFSGSASYAGGMAVLPDKLGAIQAAAVAFDAHAVPYALIGGVAVGIRSGVPRATLDVDFAVATRVDRAWLRGRLIERGFSAKGAFQHSDNFLHETGEPVQVAYDRAFDSMIERAEVMTFGALCLRIVTKADLIEMKRRAAADPGRRRSKALRDQADIALLEGDVPGSDEGW